MRSRLVVAAMMAVAVLSCSPDPAEPTPSPAAATAEPTAEPAQTAAPAEAAEGKQLTVRAPRDGDEVTTPVSVHYTVAAFAGEDMLVSADGGAGIRVRLPAASGEVLVDGLPEGTYDIGFRLARRDGPALDDPETAVTVRRVTVIEQGAGGGGLR